MIKLNYKDLLNITDHLDCTEKCDYNIFTLNNQEIVIKVFNIFHHFYFIPWDNFRIYDPH